ncbi:P-loop containing nucleoside triphosphate hydrolase protein [Trichoderma austrokoningii]
MDSEIPYIPAGCIGIHQEQSSISKHDWSTLIHGKWQKLTRSDGEARPGELCLDPRIQTDLLTAPKLRSLAQLFHAQWCQLEICVSSLDERLGIIRVYLLPDDVQRRSIDRTSSALQWERSRMLRDLDYSPCAWEGGKIPEETGEPILCNPNNSDRNHKDVSLLELFNTIPSPCPDMNLVKEPYTEDAMYYLMESKVPGLKTELYPYQRRSAALMLQKEVQPGQTLDPRLLHLKDTRGSSWYMDHVTGQVFLEPRHYDAVSGGILAEEMGSGKTVICLALILATIHLPTNPPEFYKEGQPPVRPKIASLADMAASCATRHAIPYKSYFEAWKAHGYDFTHCNDILSRNPGHYFLPAVKPPRSRRNAHLTAPPAKKKIYLSSASVVIVPNNLIYQWGQEIQKHTEGIKVLILGGNVEIPSSHDELLTYDIILFSQSNFEMIVKQDGSVSGTILSRVHFKRCIVDEGHRLGNSRISRKSNLLIGLESMHFSSRWVVTGTPSHGLYGVEIPHTRPVGLDKRYQGRFPGQLETNDLLRIGAITTLYLKARPWANIETEDGDTTADWSKYVVLPWHHSKRQGRLESLETTLNSLIIRHPTSEIQALLPSVSEKVVVLEGSYQDQLSLNLFSMMIVFNSVQSQRTDMDYFFHTKQKKSLLQIVHNLKQASFFGGSFFTADEIAKSVETAEKFLTERKFPISPEDESLLQQAIRFGNLAIHNRLRNLTNQFHEMAVSVTGFPGNAGASWSLDGAAMDGGSICTSTSMLLSLQSLVYKAARSEEKFNSLLNGELISAGTSERSKLLDAAAPEKSSKSKEKSSSTLAGNTKLGEDSLKKVRSHGINGTEPTTLAVESSAGHLEQTKITATVSAKLSYLIDALSKHQEEEKIIVFYENENVAWYLASMLDVLQIQHLIYAKSLGAVKRSHYVDAFNYIEKFRVLLMDISQAAFGLDMRAASRIYFINPALNPQVEAQAIGRARRISQKRPVTVETLVLKNSLDEVILERKQNMSQEEHRRAKSILDVRPIFNWIKNAKITPMDPSEGDYTAQMAKLQTPQAVFGKGFGAVAHHDDGLILGDKHAPSDESPEHPKPLMVSNVLKRSYDNGPGNGGLARDAEIHVASQEEPISQPIRRVRFAAS